MVSGGGTSATRCAVTCPFEVPDTGKGRSEIVTEVALQYQFVPTSDCVGTGPVDWSAGWIIRTSEIGTSWSKPSLAGGGKSVSREALPLQTPGSLLPRMA